jgi:hypothetical protein
MYNKYHSYSLFTMHDGHAVAQLVEDCATSRKVAGSILDGITGIDIILPTIPRSTQPLTEISKKGKVLPLQDRLWPRGWVEL